MRGVNDIAKQRKVQEFIREINERIPQLLKIRKRNTIKTPSLLLSCVSYVVVERFQRVLISLFFFLCMIYREENSEAI